MIATNPDSVDPVVVEYGRLWTQYQTAGPWGAFKDRTSWAILLNYVGGLSPEDFSKVKVAFTQSVQFRATALKNRGLEG